MMSTTAAAAAAAAGDASTSTATSTSVTAAASTPAESFAALLAELQVTPDAVACSYKAKERTLHVAGTLSVAEASLVNIACHRFVRDTGIPVKRAYKVETSTGGPAKDKLSVSDEELVELSETEASFKAKVQFVVDLMKNANARIVFHTGAGVSTAAKIPDFRGPNGVWTCRDRGKEAPKSISLEQAVPTFTHRVVKELVDRKIADYVVSQNVDGLHRRSGIPESKLSELHGNCFREICANCKKDYLRYYSVNRHRGPHFRGIQDELSQSGISHITGRKCDDCEGMLRDSVIHFTESLPEEHLDRAIKHTKKATMSICLGTSLYVTPAADIPEMCAPGVMVIVNLQRTGKDRMALKTGGVVVNAKCDEFMEAVAKGLGVDVPNTPEDIKKYEAEFRRVIEDEACAAKAKEDAIAAAKKKESPKPAAKRVPQTNHGLISFFSDIGLPSSMAQLPDHIVVSETQSKQGGTWTIAVQCPEGYPLDIADYVECMWLETPDGVKIESGVTPGHSPHEFKYQPGAATSGAAASGAGAAAATAAATTQATATTASSALPTVICCVRFHVGLGEVSKRPQQAKLQLAPESRETVIHKLVLPRMRMATGFLSNLTSEHSLRPVQTRVRRADGTTYIEERS